MKPEPFRINWLQVSLGFLALCLGTLVYLSDRSPESTYFVYRFIPDLSLHDRLPDLFGCLDRSLASFLHTLSFILMTGGLTTRSTVGCGVVSGAWLIVEAGFELGQKFDAAAVRLVPDWFNQVPFLEATRTFFTSGHYDPMDMAAIVAGTMAGFGILSVTRTTDKTRAGTL